MIDRQREPLRRQVMIDGWRKLVCSNNPQAEVCRWLRLTRGDESAINRAANGRRE